MTTGQTTGLTAEQLQAAIATLASPDVVDSPFGALRFFDGGAPAGHGDHDL
jgi:hypothetical protein